MKNKTKLTLNIDINITISEANIKTFISIIVEIIKKIISQISKKALPQIEKDYYEENLGKKREAWIEDKKTSFQCPKCGENNSSNFEYKGYEKKNIGIQWFFGKIEYSPQMIRCKNCGCRDYYFAKYFGLCEGKYSKDFLNFGVFLALSMSYNMAINYLKTTFANCYCTMTLWREIQRMGSEVTFKLPDKSNIVLADGTGVHVGKNKRGKELRVIMAQNKTGKFVVSNMSIKDYKNKWNDDFSILDNHKGECVCIADGDPGIEEAFLLKKGKEGIFQRDLWHLPWQFRWYCWKDAVKKEYRLEFLFLLYNIIYIPKNIDNTNVDMKCILNKEKLYDGLIEWCSQLGYKHCERYLMGAREKLFNVYKSKLKFYKFYTCSSIVERSMREINRREEIGAHWSESGLLNLMKLKMCQLYNKPLWNKLFPKYVSKNYKVSLSLCDSR